MREMHILPSRCRQALNAARFRHCLAEFRNPGAMTELGGLCRFSWCKSFSAGPENIMKRHGICLALQAGGIVESFRKNPRLAPHFWCALAMALLCLVNPVLQAQLKDVTCGGEGDRICTAQDEAFVVANTRSNSGTMCDYGLFPSPSQENPTQLVCINSTRHRLANIFDTKDPRGFVVHEQEQAIGADVPLNLVNTLGTHNSYSNYTEGMNENYDGFHIDVKSLSFSAVADPYAADQFYSIADQLSTGARFVRLDAYFYDGQMRMCHGPSHCTITSDGRLFVYAVREIADWLRTHPGEFVIIDILDSNVPSAQGAFEDDPIETYLGPFLYSPSDGLPSYSQDGQSAVWPTLRQLRSKKRQAMVFSTRDQSYAWNIHHYLQYDTNADNLVAGQNLSLGNACLDSSGQDTRRRPILQWNNAGEDRSGSAGEVEGTHSLPFFEIVNSFGLMDADHTTIAARCGASIIDLDFWGAMDHAFDFNLDNLGIRSPLADFRGPANDDRQIAASWSYGFNDSAVGPAALNEGIQMWMSVLPQASFRYACASRQDAPDVYNGLYEWKITQHSGLWSGGEAACQQLGSQYHFWFPQSVYEQSNLLRAELESGHELDGTIWLNYRSATYGHQLIVAPAEVSLSTGTGNPPTPQSVWVSGGNGGTLHYEISPGPFTALSGIDGWASNQLTLTPQPGSLSEAGTHTQELEIFEIDPVTGAAINKTIVPITVHINVPPSH
jgi:hypothetical protein